VIPRGIPIGVVMGTAAVERGWERTYLIRPLAQPAGVAHVMILEIAADANAAPAFAPGEAQP
jgi:hypothetical protein